MLTAEQDVQQVSVSSRACSCGYSSGRYFCGLQLWSIGLVREPLLGGKNHIGLFKKLGALSRVERRIEQLRALSVLHIRMSHDECTLGQPFVDQAGENNSSIRHAEPFETTVHRQMKSADCRC